MIDSIYVATSGMLGAERALNVISNNVANLNTPGFRGSSVNFASVFDGTAQDGEQNERFVGQEGLGGGGVDATGTVLDMTPGVQEQTGNALDLFLQGEGYFVVQDQDGATRYTRNGSFSFDKDGDLVANDTTSGQTLNVMTRDSTGQLTPLTLKGLQNSTAKPTTTVTFDQNLSPSDTDYSVDSVVVYDAQGGAHTLRVEFVRDSTDPTSGTPPVNTPPGTTVSWTVNVFEGTTQIGTSDLAFDGPQVLPGVSPLTINLALQGAAPTNIAFDFSAVLGDDTGGTQTTTGTTTSTLAFESQDGYAAGTVSSETFDNNGILQVTYTNGQKATGPQLVFAEIQDNSGLVELGDSLFAYQGSGEVSLRQAGSDLQVDAQSLEASNVDLTSEFSTLILMQRAYQGSSQVVSTANDMLQQLLDMKSGR
jgi:flagellar hook protein FlgE